MHVDLLTVLLAAAIYVLVSWVWYSKHLFGSYARKQASRLVLDAIFGLVIAYFLAFFNAELHVASVADGMFVSFCIWLGFMAPVQIATAVRYKQGALTFFIEAGAKLLALLAMGGLIGA